MRWLSSGGPVGCQCLSRYSDSRCSLSGGDSKGLRRLTRFYEPDLSAEVDSSSVRDATNKLVRRSYWMDMNDRTLVMVMVSGMGSHLTNDEKRAH
jgi:hypothetical protein